MPSQPKIVLHAVPFSHPVLAVSGALDYLDLEYETVQLVLGKQAEEVERIYGEGRKTVPGLLVDDEPAHGTAAVFSRIDELRPDGGLYPAAVADAVREAEAGLAQEIQQTARVLSFGALYFRPESMGTFSGIDQLDPRGVDFAIKSVRAAWRYLGITAELVHATLQELPKQLDAVDALADIGAIGGEVPTAADFQLGSTLHLLDQIADLRPLLADRPAGALAPAWFEKGAGDITAGAFPPGWVPAPGR